MNVEINGQVIAFPDNLSQADLTAAVRAAATQLGQPQGPGVAERAARLVGNFGAGANERIAQTVGALPDLYNRGLRAAGLPAMAPGAYTQAIQGGINSVVGEPPVPQNTSERLAHGAGGGVVDAASVLIPAAGIARTARAGGVAAGAAEAATAQPVMQATAGMAGGAVTEATDSPLAGAAAALAVPGARAGLSRAITPVQSQLNPEAQRLAAAAGQEGIPLTAGQRTGSVPLQGMEATFERLPLTARPQAAIRETQQVAFNRAVLQRAGIDADRATPEVLTAAQARLGAEFERLTAGTTVNLDQQFHRTLSGVVAQEGTKLPVDQRPVFTAYVRDILAAGGQMEGATYQAARSQLTARAAAATDPWLARSLRGLRDALDDAAGRSVAPEMRDDWNTVRRQYANLQVITKAATGAGQGGATGDVSAALLRSALTSGDRRGYAMGRGDLNELARIGQQFVKGQIPNSGTAERSNMTRLLTGGGLGGGGAMAAGGDPVTGAAMGVALGGLSLAAPRAVQGLYNTGAIQNWLTQTAPLVAQPSANALAPIAGAQYLRQP